MGIRSAQMPHMFDEWNAEPYEIYGNIWDGYNKHWMPNLQAEWRYDMICAFLNVTQGLKAFGWFNHQSLDSTSKQTFNVAWYSTDGLNIMDTPEWWESIQKSVDTNLRLTM